MLPDWDKQLLQLKFSKTTYQLKKWGIVKIFRFIHIFSALLFRCVTQRLDFVYFTIVPTSAGFIRDLLFVLVIKVFRITPVFHLHLMGINRNSRIRVMRKLYRWTFSNSVVIHLSEKVYLSEFGDLNLKNHRYFIQSNGIPEVARPGTIKSRKDVHILHISHLYRFKGALVLLEAFSSLMEEGHDIILDIIGDIADKEVHKKIMEFSARTGMQNRIIWHGLKTGQDKNDIIAGADIMALPTMNDTFPLTILEGMQHSLPVIASSKGAIPEIIEDGKSGYLITPGDHGQLKGTSKNLMLI